MGSNPKIGTVLFIFFPIFSENNACHTPDDRRLGSCIAYIYCNSVIQLLLQKDPKLDNYVIRSVCGYDKDIPMVCCPFETTSNLFYFSTTPSTVPKLKLPTNDKDKCGMSNGTHGRVVGGVNAQRNSWPWMVALGYYSASSVRFLCAGVLITSLNVLTAAHCIIPSLYFVRLGILDISTDRGFDIYISKSIVHELYHEENIANDISMLKLASPAPISQLVSPICLPFQESFKTMDLTNYQPFVIGWGTTSFKGTRANILQEAQVVVMPEDKCAENYRRYFPKQEFDDTVKNV